MDCLWCEYPQIPTLQSHVYPPGPWRLPPLFGTNSYGKTQVWQIGYDGADNYFTCHGLQEGKKRTVSRNIRLNSSGRSYPEQAFLECLNRYNDKKVKDGYREYGIEPVRFTKPMLANSYDPSQVSVFPIAVQPKLDGIRLLIHNKVEGFMMHTRNGRQVHYPHLHPELTAFFSTLPLDVALDGELYKHGWEFERLSSAARTESPTPDTLIMEYHIYDIVMPGTYDVRYEEIQRIFQISPFQLLQKVQTDLAHSRQEIENASQHYLSQRYEGIMLRRIPQSGEQNTHYVFGRSTNLLKYKPFLDTEVRIIRVESSEGTEVDCALFVVAWHNGEELRVRPMGSHDMRRLWFQQPHLVVGKMATIRYNEVTNRGIPRFPRLHSIRDYE